ncbi:hypothetical protein AT15_01905 [Kosmotoga arenicorallina S304]|uniref:N-acetyltransferase domain-containing protein n=1 Tax=Kosmotoga arenicorallina S304 TaxID=1453497 RepID=A0A176JZE3_9BACT|nr:GNAT family N-acetyltransferase [Kosmotoga arenicorallina]OAA29451.1 hypothetical protein AT15_01905 [Kosmotoga arenicorallina S304]
MHIQKNENAWNITDENEEIARVSGFAFPGDALFANVQLSTSLSIQKKKEILKLLSEELKKEFHERSIQLFLDEGQMHDHETDVYFTLNRVRMFRSLENIPEVHINEREIHSLNFEDIAVKAQEIFDATPEYDRKMINMNCSKDVRKFYKEIIVEKAIGKYLSELSFGYGKDFLKGFIINMEIENVEKTLLVGDIIVLEEYRRQGIATQLIVHSLKRAKVMGFEKAILDVTASNPANNLYEKLGFKEFKTVTSIFVK